MGSTFYFELPLYSASSAGVEAGSFIESPAGHQLDSYHSSSEGSGIDRVQIIHTPVDSAINGMPPVDADLPPLNLLHPSGDLEARPLGIGG